MTNGILLAAMTVLLGQAAATSEITAKSWATHPRVVESRAVFEEVNALEAAGGLKLESKDMTCAANDAFTSFDEEGMGGPGYEPTTRRIVGRDGKGTIRKLTLITSGTDGSTKDGYYDASGRLRFLFDHAGADRVEARSWFDGSRLVWSQIKWADGSTGQGGIGNGSEVSDVVPGFAFPEVPCKEAPPGPAPLDPATWRESAGVKEIRAIHDQVEANVRARKLEQKTRRFDACPVYEDSERRLFADAEGRPRRYVSVIGTQTRQHDYDEGGRLRFVFIRDTASPGPVERRIYRDVSGRRLWEMLSPALPDSEERTEPRVWREASLVLDPKAELEAPSDCAVEIVAGVQKPARPAKKPVRMKKTAASAAAIEAEVDRDTASRAFEQRRRFLEGRFGDDCEHERNLWLDARGIVRRYDKSFDCSGDSSTTHSYTYDAKGVLRALTIRRGSIHGGGFTRAHGLDENGNADLKETEDADVPLLRRPARDFGWPVRRGITEDVTPSRVAP